MGSSVAGATGLGGMLGNSPWLQQQLAMRRFNNRTSAENTAIAAAADTSNFNNSPGWTGNQSIITSDMSVPTEGMAQDNLGIEPMETVTNGGNTVIDGVPVTTVGGGFSPQTTQAAQGIYGDISQRQRTLKKPLIKLT